MSQPQPERDILKSDPDFLEFMGSLLFGLGGFMLVMQLLCALTGMAAFCWENYFPAPYLSDILQPTFFRILLPLSMVILGIGLGMFSKIGWMAAQFILFFYVAFFGYSLIILGFWWRFYGTGFSDKLAFVLHMCIFLWSCICVLYLFFSRIRLLYF